MQYMCMYCMRFDRLQQEPQSSAVLQTYTHASYRLPSDLHSCLIPIAVRLTLVYMTRVVFLLDQYIDTCGLPAGSAHRHMWSSETGTGVIQVFDRSLIYDYYITSLPIPSLPCFHEEPPLLHPHTRHTKHIHTQFRPIHVVWFDCPHRASHRH